MNEHRTSVGGRQFGKTEALTRNVIDYLREQSSEDKGAILDANSQLLLLGYIDGLEQRLADAQRAYSASKTGALD